ncbi:MAG: hypothetical protein K8T20_09375 [Planctomycetes bacterium]|nr:hypothetical protein [Planctomycetota bacterium]
MRTLLIAGIALLATAAVAERAAREFEVKRLEVASPDGRIVATAKGFVVLERGKAGDRIVHRDRDGKEIAELVNSEGRIDRWWAAPGGGAVACLRGINELSFTVVGAPDEPATPEYLLAGDVAFSPDSRRVAFRSGDAVVARDVAPKGWRVEIPASAVLEGPVWSGDGKALVVISGKSSVVNGVLKSHPDAVEWCDPKAEKLEWKKLFHSETGTVAHLAAEPTGRRVAFMETMGGWKLRLFNLDKGELDVLDESGGTRSLAFTAAGDILVTADTRAGRVEAWLIGTVRGGTMKGVARDRVGDLPDDDVDAASSAAGDIWLVTHAAGKKDMSVVRVTPK